MTPLLHLVVRSVNVPFRTFVNGVPLAYDERAEGFFSRIPLNEWLMPSGNRVDIDLKPPAARVPNGTEFEATLSYPEEDYRQPQQRFFWRMDQDEEIKAFRVSFPFPLPVKVATKLWNEATTLETFDDAAKAQATELSLRVYEAFASKNLDKVCELFEYRIADVARAWGDDPDDDRQGARNAYGRLVNDEKFAIEPIDPSKLDFTLCGDRKLVMVTRLGQPLIDTVPSEDGPSGTIPIFLARLKDRWVVAR